MQLRGLRLRFLTSQPHPAADKLSKVENFQKGFQPTLAVARVLALPLPLPLLLLSALTIVGARGYFVTIQ